MKLKRTLSVVLAIAMVFTVFTVFTLTVVTPAAAEGASKMIHVDNGTGKAGYVSYVWIPPESDGLLKPSTKYRLSFCWENVSNAPIDSKMMFMARYCDTGGNWPYLFDVSDSTCGSATERSMKKTELMHGQRIEFDFTTPADCRDGNSIWFYFGDCGWYIDGKRMVFNLTNIRLYTRDDGDNLTEIPMTDICADENLGDFAVEHPYEGEDWPRGQVLERGGKYPRKGFLTFQDIPDKYFNEVYIDSLSVSGGPGSFTTPASLKPDTTYTFSYKSLFEAGAKVDPYVELYTNSGNVRLDTTNCRRNSDGENNTAFAFKTPSNLSSGSNARLGVNIATAVADCEFADFSISECGSDGNASGGNLISSSTLSAETVFVENAADLTEGKWLKEGAFSKCLVHTIPIANFGVKSPHMMMFNGGNSTGSISQTLSVKRSVSYRLTFNLKHASLGFEGDKTHIKIEYMKSGGFVDLPFTESYDEEHYLQTCEFTIPTNATAVDNNLIVSLIFDKYSVSGYASNFELYKLSGGNTVGDNFITNGDFSTGDGTGWTVKKGGEVLLFVKTPENFFNTNPGNKMHAIQFRDTVDWELVQQMLWVKPNTRYQLDVTTLVTGYGAQEPINSLYQKVYIDEGKTKDEWQVVSNNPLASEEEEPVIVSEYEYLNKDSLGEFFDTSEPKYHAIKLRRTFRTSENLRTDSNNNLSIRYYFMNADSGYVSDFALYELDENGNPTGNNIVLDGDFSSGITKFDSGETPWRYSGDAHLRNIELEDGFFTKYSIPEQLIQSNGSVANATYENQMLVDPSSRYYFSGNIVRTNAQGINPEVLYRSVAVDGEYASIPLDLYFDSVNYYFETEGGIKIPDDALLNSEGKADIIVRLNNLDHGKGYFCNITFTKDDSGNNLFDDSKASSAQFTKIDYDPEIFSAFTGDERFEDIGWDTDVETFALTTGDVDGTVYDYEGAELSGVKMKLTPGNLTAVTGNMGLYQFSKLAPGKYSLYLIEESGNEIFCCDLTVEAGMVTTVPDITYIVDDGEEDEDEYEYDDDDGVGEVIVGDRESIKDKYGMIKGYCYDSTGKLLSGIDIYIDSKSHHAKTDSKGVFEFDQVPPGKHKVCTILDDGTVYVFRTINVEAGKGMAVRVMIPDPDSGFPVWATVLIIAGGIVVLAAGALATILLIMKKKKASVPTESPAAEEIAE